MPGFLHLLAPNGAEQASPGQARHERRPGWDAAKYVEGQEDRHKKVPFQDEIRSLCRAHGIEIDERYGWD